MNQQETDKLAKLFGQRKRLDDFLTTLVTAEKFGAQLPGGEAYWGLYGPAVWLDMDAGWREQLKDAVEVLRNDVNKEIAVAGGTA